MALSGRLLSLNVARASAVTIDGREVHDRRSASARSRARARSGRSASTATSRPTSRCTAARARRSTPIRASTTRSGRRCARRPASRRGTSRCRAGCAGREPDARRRRRERRLDRRRAALSELRARGQRAALALLQVQRRDGLQARRQADGAKRLVRLVPRGARARHDRRRRELRRSIPGPREVGIVELFRARTGRAEPRPALAMLAYRHAFHAGNHADVLKHLVLMLVLRHMNAKDKPYRFVDTHAGAGGYSLRRPLRAEEGRVRARHRPALDARRPAGAARRLRRAGAPLQSRRRARRSTPARPRSRRCCCARRTSCARSSCIRPSRRSCARRSPATAARPSTTATASSACARRCRRRSRRAVVLIDPSYEGNGDYAKVDRQRCARRWRASPRASTSSGIRRSARSRRRSCRAA